MKLNNGTFYLKLNQISKKIKPRQTIDLLNNPKKYEKEFLDEWIDWNNEYIIGAVSDEGIETYREELKEGAINSYYGLLSNFNDLPDPFHIYRSIRVSDFNHFYNLLKKGEFIESYLGIGVYWTWDIEYAQPYWSGIGGFDETAEIILITASISKKNINWWLSILKNTDVRLGESTDEPERELQVYEGADLTIIEIKREDKDKIFKDLKIKTIAKINPSK